MKVRLIHSFFCSGMVYFRKSFYKEQAMTEKLYYQDSHIREFTASVLSCEETGRGFEVLLQRTAFFPEGGGQPCDTGTIEGVNVVDVFERGGDVVHVTDGPLSTGGEYRCAIEWTSVYAACATIRRSISSPA